MSKRRIVLVGGGTGGHFYPLMAIAEELRGNPDVALYYMGPDEYDAPALKRLGISFVRCPSGKRRKYFSLLNIADAGKTFFGFFVALIKLFTIYPDAIMSKGGYTSVPVILAGWFLRIPIVVHESDAVPGSANKLAGRFARYVAISYRDTSHFFKAEKTALTGIPIRGELLNDKGTASPVALGLTEGLPVLLVLGGSQGAQRVNELILRSLDQLLPNFSVIHQTGSAHFDIVAASARALIKDEALLAHYHPVAFFEAPILNEALFAADLVISRAGSGTIFEIGVHGKPSILIPIPEEISHDQRTNAYAYARSGAASVIEERNLEASLLVAEISRIMNDKGMYAGMAEAARAFTPRDAAKKIATILTEIANEHW